MLHTCSLAMDDCRVSNTVQCIEFDGVLFLCNHGALASADASWSCTNLWQPFLACLFRHSVANSQLIFMYRTGAFLGPCGANGGTHFAGPYQHSLCIGNASQWGVPPDIRHRWLCQSMALMLQLPCLTPISRACSANLVLE